jgi:hypothetical protein
MSVAGGPDLIQDGLVLCLDAANTKSYPGSGTSWVDLSGNGNNGTLTNGPTFNSANGGSIDFDGSNDFIQGTIPSSVFSGAHTISCWFYRRSLSGWSGLFSNNVGTNSCTILTFIENTNTVGTNRAGLSATSIAVNLGADHFNKWIYCTIVYSNITNGSAVNVYAYKDKNLLTATGNLYWTLSSSNSYYVGRHWQGDTQVHNGLISSTSVYNRALSAAEIHQNYNATKGRFRL